MSQRLGPQQHGARRPWRLHRHTVHVSNMKSATKADNLAAHTLINLTPLVVLCAVAGALSCILDTSACDVITRCWATEDGRRQRHMTRHGSQGLCHLSRPPSAMKRKVQSGAHVKQSCVHVRADMAAPSMANNLCCSAWGPGRAAIRCRFYRWHIGACTHGMALRQGPSFSCHCRSGVTCNMQMSSKRDTARCLRAGPGPCSKQVGTHAQGTVAACCLWHGAQNGPMSCAKLGLQERMPSLGTPQWL